jgi:hypothetical protein
MKLSLLGVIVLLLSGCAATPAIQLPASGNVEPAVASRPETAAETSQAETPELTGTFDAPAEPFSAAWREPEWDESPPAPIDSWVNADACPDPLETTREFQDRAYEAFIDKALGLGASGELAVLRIHPSFTPVRSLVVLRRRSGAYLLRSIRLKTNVWAQMMQEMRTLHGDSFSLDEASEAAALARIATSRITHDTEIDASIAWLVIELWRSVMARAQPVVEIGTMTAKADGTTYEMRQGGRGSQTHSPAEDSVLGDLVSAAEHLERFSDGTSSDKNADLQRARDLMRSSLDRTRRNEPCLRHIPAH